MPESLSPLEKHCSSRRQLPSNVVPLYGGSSPFRFPLRYDFSRNSASRFFWDYWYLGTSNVELYFAILCSFTRFYSSKMVQILLIAINQERVIDNRGVETSKIAPRRRRNRWQMFPPRTIFSFLFLENERRYFIVPDVGRSQTGRSDSLHLHGYSARND